MKRDYDFYRIDKVRNLFGKTFIICLTLFFDGMNILMILLGILPGYKWFFHEAEWYVIEEGKYHLLILGGGFLMMIPFQATSHIKGERDTMAVILHIVTHLLSGVFVAFFSAWWIGGIVVLSEYIVGAFITIIAHFVYRKYKRKAETIGTHSYSDVKTGIVQRMIIKAVRKKQSAVSENADKRNTFDEDQFGMNISNSQKERHPEPVKKRHGQRKNRKRN
ncbi:MAG: hypothetical protein J6Y48_16625 [Clostridia bacterium]|nr:hypothetical protein [Clostridia bacterium]